MATFPLAGCHGSDSTKFFFVLASPPAVYITDGYHSAFHSSHFFPLFLQIFSWVTIPDGGIAYILPNSVLQHFVSGGMLINNSEKTHKRTSALPVAPSRTGTGSISASSLPHSALCSFHFPPVSDPLPLLHFNPPAVPPCPDRGLKRESGSRKEGVVPFG